MKQCLRCNQEFDGTKRQSKKFCTENCRINFALELRLHQSMDQKRRWAILVRDNFTCRYCGRSPSKHDVWLALDHVVPASKGGSNLPENLVTACSECNRGKSSDEITKLPERKQSE